MLGVVVALTVSCQATYRMTPMESYLASNGAFSIDVRTFQENSQFLPGMLYVYYSIEDDGTRTEILRFRVDDPGPIRKESVVFVSDRVAFISIGWIFASTSDGGETWAIWDAAKNLDGWECCSPQIGSVSIRTDGRGEMTLIGNSPEKSFVLQTDNYGRNWSHSF